MVRPQLGQVGFLSVISLQRLKRELGPSTVWDGTAAPSSRSCLLGYWGNPCRRGRFLAAAPKLRNRWAVSGLP